MSDAIAFRCASIPALTEADADANAGAASTPGLAWDRVPRRLRRSATPERSPYTAELPGQSLRCHELHAGRWSFVGLRLGETYGLRPGDVDFMRRIVHPQVQYQAEDSRPRFPGLPSRSRYRWLLSCLLTSQGTARYGTLLTGEYGYQLPPWAPKRATRTARKRFRTFLRASASGPTVTSPPASPLRPSLQPGPNSAGTAVSRLHDSAGHGWFSRHTS